MVLSCFSPLIGGGERQAQQLAARLVRRGFDVRVLTRRYRSLAGFDTIDGVPVYRVPIVGRGPVQALAFTLAAFRALARMEGRVTVVHCHQSSLGVAPIAIASLAKRKWGCRVIVKFMGARVREMTRTHTWSIRRWLLCQADAFVVTNEGTGRTLRDMGLDVAIHCLPNGVDIQQFQPIEPGARDGLRESLALPSQACVVLYVGRLEAVKGGDVLLRAWARLVDESGSRSLLLAMVGGGSERGRLIQLSRELGIASSVRFVGLSDRVSDWLHVADLFVLPSRSEGLSNALLEAMACGLPAVATAVGGTPEVIKDGMNGLLVPADDESALANALGHLVDDPDLARLLGAAAYKTILEQYSMEAMVDRYVELYESLTGLRASECVRASECAPRQ
jgi:glycosyltransferase involved in cell wall biosynthesis